MRSLRILHVTPYWAEAWAYGGIPRVVGALTCELAREGHAVTVCATDAFTAADRLPGGPTGRAGAIPWPPVRTESGVELRIFPNRSNRLAYAWQAFTPSGLGRYLHEHAGEFDVAHLHACRNLPGLIAARHLVRRGVPYVVAPNGTAPILERRRLVKRAFDAIGGRWMLRKAACVLAVSDAERRQLIDLGVSADRVRVVPNPVDLGEFDAPVARGCFRRAHGLDRERLIVFLGKITPRKRLDVLVRAFADLGDDTARLVIAGNDMGSLSEALALARSLGIDRRVLATGLLTGADRLRVLADADVVVYPSEDEIFGLVPIEALLAGVPVIVSNDSGCGEIVGEIGGGLAVTVGSAAGLSDALGRILTAPDMWRRRAAEAAALARSRFGAAIVTRQLVGVYRELAAAAPAGEPAGVSVVVPVRNGASCVLRAIASIEAQADTRPMEIIVVDDRSTDASRAVLEEVAEAGRIRLIAGAGRGAAAAINLGVAVARYPFIAQVDQDVELRSGWMARLVGELERDPAAAAAQGYYETDARASVFARISALDLEQRYVHVRDREMEHVCTGNTVYRARAIADAGGFDEALGYGYDNDMSYRLRAAGHRLVMCREARSRHRWREGVAGYCRQQYGYGYGRLDLLAKHPRRIGGDNVSPAPMMAHPVVTAIAGICLLVAGALSATGGDNRIALWLGLGLALSLAVDRAVAGVRAAARFGDATALLFPLAHLLRDLSWVAAIGTWGLRRIAGRQSTPADSMRARAVEPAVAAVRCGARVPTRVIGVIPAHNEAATLSAVVAEVRAWCPGLDLLVVDDGSTDDTPDVVADLGVRSLRLSECMGVGSAMRAGLRYARRLGYDGVIRIDGDGQHHAADIRRVLAPLLEGEADVVLGSRFTGGSTPRPVAVRALQRLLGACLSLVTGRRVTDPTSGFCAIGPRALRLLAEHHPTGYPEPELRLLLSRHGLTVEEVPVRSRDRLGGRTTLTAGRMTAAGARVLLALVIVPLRSVLRGADRD